MPNLLANIELTTADTAPVAFADVLGLSATVNVQGTDSIILLLATVQHLAVTSQRMLEYRFAIGGVREGPNIKVSSDDDNELGYGLSGFSYYKTGLSGSQTFSIQWQRITGVPIIDTAKIRSFQILEILPSDVAEILAEVDTTAGGSGSDPTFIDVPALFATVTVASVDSIILLIASVPHSGVDNTDRGAAFRFGIGGAEEGPEVLSPSDRTKEMTSLSGFQWVKTGLTGSQTFSIRWVTAGALGFAKIDTARNRTFQVVEIIGAALTEKVASDLLDIDLVEVALLQAQADVDDTLDLEVNEDPALVDVGITAEDLLDQEVNEDVADLLGLIEPEDTTGVSVDELAEILARAERLDTLDIDLIEAAELLARLARTDDLDLEIVEDAGRVVVGVTALDDLDLEILEGVGQVVVGIQVEDTLSLALIEATTLLGLIDRSDDLNLALVEGVPLVFVRLNRDDLLDLEIVEDAGQISVGITAADTLDLAVVEEVSQLLSLIEQTDLLDLSLDDQADLLVLLERLDDLDLTINEIVTDVSVLITAADDLDIDITDLVFDLCVAMTAADDLDLDLGELAEVFRTAQVFDTLNLEILEAPGQVVEQLLFEGIITKAITLQVLRTQRVTLPVTRTVRFTLEIDPGVQR